MSEESTRFVFRSMRESDISNIVAIDRASFPTPWPRSAYFHELRRGISSRFYVLEKAETRKPILGWRRRLGLVGGSDERRTLIGYLGFYVQGTDAHVSTIAIHPEWRGQGFGEFLLWQALNMIAALGNVLSSSLEVRPSNQVALSLYAKYGYRHAGDHRGYYRDGEDAWLMVLSPIDSRYRRHLGQLGEALLQRIPRVTICIGQNRALGL